MQSGRVDGSRARQPIEESSSPQASFGADAVEVPLLPEPALSRRPCGDPGAELAMLVLEAAKEDKKIGRTIREHEELAQRASEDAQLDAMERKADASFTAGMIGGFTTAASAFASFGAAAASCEASTVDAKNSNLARKGGPTVAETARSVDLHWDGVTKSIEATGKIGSALAQRDADRADREVTKQAQIAGRHQRAGEEAREAVRDAKELVDRVIGFYKEYVAAKADAERAALMRA